MIYCKAKLNSSGDKSIPPPHIFLKTILNKKHFREMFAYLELTTGFTSFLVYIFETSKTFWVSFINKLHFKNVAIDGCCYLLILCYRCAYTLSLLLGLPNLWYILGEFILAEVHKDNFIMCDQRDGICCKPLWEIALWLLITGAWVLCSWKIW
jgi:hypothetical protein